MSVRKRTWINDSGTTGEAWVCRYRDAEGKQRLKTFEREREAKAWEAQMRVDLKQGTHRPERTSVTIRKAGALLLETCEAEDVDPATIEFYEKHLRVHIYPATASKTTPNAWEGQLGELKVSKITSPMCEVFKRLVLQTKARTKTGKVTDRKIARKTARHILATLKTMLFDAQRRGLITYNPAQPVRIKKKDRDVAPMSIGEHIPDRADIMRIVSASDGMWRVLFKTDATTGMRTSELRSLTWPSVRLECNEIKVLNRASRKRKAGSVKTKNSYRTIQIGDDLVAELRRWKEVCPPSDFNLVFPDEHGNVMSEGKTRNALYRVQEQIGMVKAGRDGKPRAKYNVHSLRHFFSSIMIAEGIQPKRLQELIGHSSLQMTMDLYGHMFPPTSDEIDRINRATAKVFTAAAA
jgi:integrase